MKAVLAVLTLFLCVIGVATAQEPSRDPRLRVLAYEEGRVIALDGHLGYQMMIEFDPGERIENVSIGDSLAWQVTPNRAATLLFIKPVVEHAVTNMTVVTTRRCAFALRAREALAPEDPRITYGLRFTYAEDPVVSSEAAPATFNFDYLSSGSQRLAPVRIFDDGRFTYFQLREGAEIPAIFALAEEGDEELVNSQMQGDVVVVDLVADGFVLRYGSDATIVRRSDAPLAAEPAAQRHRSRRGRRR